MATEAKILYTTAPAAYDREASTILTSPYYYTTIGPLRKILVPGPDYAVQFNAYLRHAAHATIAESMLERLLRNGTVKDIRETSVAAQEVIKRNNDNNDKEHDMASRNADVVTDTAAQTKTRKGGRKAPARTNNTETTVVQRPDSVHIVEHPANVPVPQASALDGMTPLGVDPAPEPETIPAALDTPAEQAAAQPKKARKSKKAQQEPAPAPEPEGPAAEAAPVDVIPEPATAPAVLLVPQQSASFEEKVSYLHLLLACDVETIQTAFREGFVAVGTREKAPRAATSFTPNPHSKMAQMTFAIAQTIRAEAAKKELTQKQLADKFDTTRIMIWDILHGVRFVVESEGSKTRPKSQWTK